VRVRVRVRVRVVSVRGSVEGCGPAATATTSLGAGQGRECRMVHTRPPMFKEGAAERWALPAQLIKKTTCMATQRGGACVAPPTQEPEVAVATGPRQPMSSSRRPLAGFALGLPGAGCRPVVRSSASPPRCHTWPHSRVRWC